MGRCRAPGWILTWPQPMVYSLLTSTRTAQGSAMEGVSEEEGREGSGGNPLTHTNPKDKINKAIKLQQKQGRFFFVLLLLFFFLSFFFFPVWMLITVPYSRDNERVLLPSIFQTKTWKIHEQGRPWCWASVFLSNISAPEVLGKVTQQYSSLKDACQLDLKATGIL